MRALVLQGDHHLLVEERESEAVGFYDVRINVIATGICGSDLHGYTGENGRRHPGQVMGHEFVGRISEIGAGVIDSEVRLDRLVTVNPVIGCGECAQCHAGKTLDCGERVVIGVDPRISSAFAGNIVVPARNVVPFSAEAHPFVGALVEPLAVGYRAARRGGVGPGSAVVVLGGGPIGQAAALGARRLGAQVIVTETIQSRATLVRSLGIEVLDPRGGDLAGRVSEALGGAPEVVIDAVGISATLGDALAISSRKATVVLVGMGQPQIELDAYSVSTQERVIVGSFCYDDEEFATTAVWAAENAAELEVLIGATVPLLEADAAFAALAAGTSSASKILVTMSGAQ